MVGILGKREPLGRVAGTFNFAVGAIGLGILVALSLAAPFPEVRLDLALTFLALFGLARLLRFEIPPNITASLIVPIQLASILLLGAVPTAWIALPAFFTEVIREKALKGLSGEKRRAMLGIIAFNLGMEALVTLAAGMTWRALQGGEPLDTSPASLLALFVTFVVFKTVNEVLMVAGHWLRGVAVTEYLGGARTTVLIETITMPMAALLVLVEEGLDRVAFYLFVAGTVLAAVTVRNLTRARAELAGANADLERKVREIATLADIGRAISADIELDSLLDTIYRRVADILQARHFFVALWTEGDSELRIALEMIDGEPQAPKTIPMGAGLTSQVLRSRQPLLVRDMENELASLPVQPLVTDDRPNRSWLGVPMIARGEVVGAVVLQEARPGAHDENDLRILSAIASQAAISIKNARLHQEALNALRVEAENRELKRINAKKSDFVNMVAHQFRTPLTTVIGYAHLLVERIQVRGTAEGPDVRRHLETVHAESRRLAEMVEELLNLSRIRSGRLPLTMQTFDLDRLVREVLSSHEMLARPRGLQLAAEAPDGRGTDVVGDSNFIRHAVANVLANAIKYAPSGSRILVTTRRAEGTTIVEILDEGPGVQADDLERVWDEFYRAPGPTLEAPGTGLGLSITRGIVEAHGGRTWAERRGAGTAFCMAFPDARAEGGTAATPGVAAPAGAAT